MQLNHVRGIGFFRVALIIGGFVFALFLGYVIPVAGSGQLLGLGARDLTFIVLLVVSMNTVVLFLIRPEETIFLGVASTGLLISQTGMQLDVGPVRTSALEVLLVALFLGHGILIAGRHRMAISEPYPLVRPTMLFFPFLLWILMSLARDVPVFAIISTVKGYYLYGALSFLAFRYIKTRQQLYLYAAIGIVASVTTAASAFTQPGAGNAFLPGSGSVVARQQGSFGTINQLGFYAASFALLTVALIVEHPRLSVRIIAAGVAIICSIAMILTLSRGAVLGYAIGAIILLFFTKHRSQYAFVIVLAGLVLIMTAPDWFWERNSVESFNDHSTDLRERYLQIGLRAMQAYPLGAGWGAWFGLSRDSLYPAAQLPWAHNDYVNLAVQVGVLGLLAFLSIWYSYYRFVWAKLKETSIDDELRAFMLGGLAATAALLVHAATDHLFWRPDIAGQIWWVAGLALASARIASSPEMQAAGKP